MAASWSCSALVAVATTTFGPGQDGGHQVGERLAGARAGLDHEVALVGDGRPTASAIVDLAGPGLAATGQGPGDPTNRGRRRRWVADQPSCRPYRPAVPATLIAPR